MIAPAPALSVPMTHSSATSVRVDAADTIVEGWSVEQRGRAIGAALSPYTLALHHISLRCLAALAQAAHSLSQPDRLNEGHSKGRSAAFWHLRWRLPGGSRPFLSRCEVRHDGGAAPFIDGAGMNVVVFGTGG